MALISINEVLKDTVLGRLRAALSGLFALDIQLYSSDNADPNSVVKPLYIDEYTIVQEFTKTYMDVVYMTAHVSPAEFMKIYNNHQNLYCSMTSYPVNDRTHIPMWDLVTSGDITGLGWSHTYRAIVLGIADIAKSLNPSQIQVTENNSTTELTQSQKIELAVQLVDEDAYNLRTKTFSINLSNVTVKDAIYTAANMLDISNINMQEPDNTTPVNQITFPPMQSLETFIPMLQNNYPGIYQQGCEYYYTNGTLYIYPGYKVDPSRSDPIVNVYKIPKDMYPGLFGYQSVDADGNIHIVSNTETAVQDTAPESLENMGNHVVTTNASATIDLSRKMEGKDGTFSDSNLISIGMTNVDGNSTGKYKTVYVSASSNPFKMASDMIANNKVEVELGYSNPLPYSVNPGQRVIYHYEDTEGYKTRCGIIDSAVYTFNVNSHTSDYIYKGTCKLRLRLASDSETLVQNEGTSNDSSSGDIFSIASNFSMDSLKSLVKF